MFKFMYMWSGAECAHTHMHKKRKSILQNWNLKLLDRAPLCQLLNLCSEPCQLVTTSQFSYSISSRDVFQEMEKDLLFRGLRFVLNPSPGIFKSNVKTLLSKTNSISNLLKTVRQDSLWEKYSGCSTSRLINIYGFVENGVTKRSIGLKPSRYTSLHVSNKPLLYGQVWTSQMPIPSQLHLFWACSGQALFTMSL